MTGLLLDTHIWIWYAEGVPEKLDEQVLGTIENSLHQRRLYVSSVSVWEIGLLCAKNRIALSGPTREWINAAISLPGLRLKPLGADAAIEGALLPGAPHADPADRLLIGEARTSGLTLVTRDQKILDYGRAGHVHVLPA